MSLAPYTFPDLVVTCVAGLGSVTTLPPSRCPRNSADRPTTTRPAHLPFERPLSCSPGKLSLCKQVCFFSACVNSLPRRQNPPHQSALSAAGTGT